MEALQIRAFVLAGCSARCQLASYREGTSGRKLAACATSVMLPPNCGVLRLQSHVTDLTGNTFIDGPAGELEAILKEPDGPITRAAIVCHPHPLFGGTM